MECKCGFKFSGPGEYRNSHAFLMAGGIGGVICPKCETHYLDCGIEISWDGNKHNIIQEMSDE